MIWKTLKMVRLYEYMYAFDLMILGDPFMKHFANENEVELTQQISDVHKDSWLVAKGGKDSVWSCSIKYPSSLKVAPVIELKLPWSTQELHVRFLSRQF